MALSLIGNSCRSLRFVQKISSMQTASVHYRDLIGKREIVGFGFNGQPSYVDRTAFPFPAIRWREPNPEIEELRKKEKGDWHKLSLCEKKLLYRASFCQTFAEFTAPTGEWKSVIGVGCIMISVACWLQFFFKTMVYSPFPITFDEERRRAQFRRMLDIEANPVRGLATMWDYDKDDWK